MAQFIINYVKSCPFLKFDCSLALSELIQCKFKMNIRKLKANELFFTKHM